MAGRRPSTNAFVCPLSRFTLQVSTEERKSLEAELLATSPQLAGPDWHKETFFKVPWTLVPDLVAKRKVYLKAGLAYVPQKEQLSLVLQAFQERLERGLEVRTDSFLSSHRDPRDPRSSTDTVDALPRLDCCRRRRSISPVWTRTPVCCRS